MRLRRIKKRYPNILIILLMASFLISPPALAEDKILRMSFNSSWAPFSSGEMDGVDGLLPKLISEVVEKRMGIKVQHFGYPWSRAQRQVENGQLDALVTNPTPSRLVYTNRSSETVYTFEIRPIIKRASAAEKMLESLPPMRAIKKLKFCFGRGNGWAKVFTKKNNLTIHSVKDLSACFRMIEKGRMDITLASVAAATQLLEKSKNLNSLMIAEPIFEKWEFPLLLRKSSKLGADFLNQFDQILRAMKSDGSYKQLIKDLRNVN